jgi:hypothetical protein
MVCRPAQPEQKKHILFMAQTCGFALANSQTKDLFLPFPIDTNIFF